MSILINSSHAQSVDNFKTYTNNDLNFTIQHPSNWEVDDEEDSTKHLVEDNLAGSTSLKTLSFYAPSDHPEADNIPRKYLSEPTFKITIHKVLPYLDTDTMALKNTTLQQSVQKWLDFYSSLDTPYKLIRQNEVTVGGNTGEKIEYTSGIYYDSVVFTVSNGKLYNLAYKDDPLKVPETLPLANKMVESFQVNTADEDTSNNSAVEDTSNNSAVEDYQNKNCPPMSLVLCGEPRCPNGYHRSPDGDCEPARDVPPELGK